MIKGNPIHDTIVIVKKDTIIKVVELVSKAPEPKTPALTQWFNDYSDVTAFFGTIATAGALIVAIIAIFKTAKDSRHQLLVGKFEEMYSLIYILLPEYLLFFQLDKILENHHNETLPADQRANFLLTYRSELEGVKAMVNIDDLFSKIARLSVLANAYLDKELKNEVLAYSKLFEMILIVSTQQQMAYKYTNFKNGFPQYENVQNFASVISKKLIVKINLGGENAEKSIFYEYFRNKFQLDLGLKKDNTR